MGFLKQKAMNNLLLIKLRNIEAVSNLHEAKAKDLQSQINSLAEISRSHNNILMDEAKKHKMTHKILTKMNTTTGILERKFNQVCDLFTGGSFELPEDLKEVEKEVEVKLREGNRVKYREVLKGYKGMKIIALNDKPYLLCESCHNYDYFFVDPKRPPPLCNNCGIHQGDIIV